jgi:hypothetical protein
MLMRRAFRCGLCFCALALAVAPVAAAAEFFVDQHHPKAGDKNPGTTDMPFASISAAAQIAAGGDTVWIRSGIYRESVQSAHAGTVQQPIVFSAAPGAMVIVSGADRVTGWHKEDGADQIFSVPWAHAFMTHPDDDFHRLTGRCEQVFVSGYALHQVLERSRLERGSFWVDLPGKRLWAWSPGNDHLDTDDAQVEASVRDVIWNAKGDYVAIRGLRFRYAANHAQQGALHVSGKGVVLEDCVFERTNALGAFFAAEGITVRRCIFQDNGQMGFGATRAHGLHVVGCIIRNNNIKDFSRGWEAGGDKICLSRGVVLEQCQFIENRGTGVWFDIGNEDCDVHNCLIADNEDAGIFYEISYGLNAHDNVIIGNGLNDSPGAWGAASGIALSSSPGCTIERNLLIGNKEGFNFREQGRTAPRIDAPNGSQEEAIWNHDQVVRNNVMAYNRDAQTWGWFDIADGRHWPAALQEHTPESGEAASDVAKDYKADKAKIPPGLNLARLKIAFSNNLYATLPGQQLFNWGVPWKKNRRFANLDEVRKELNLEVGSALGDPAFANGVIRDFSVPRESPIIKMGCYPKGLVPGVILGVR